MDLQAEYLPYISRKDHLETTHPPYRRIIGTVTDMLFAIFSPGLHLGGRIGE
jgi:hypothetical protein